MAFSGDFKVGDISGNGNVIGIGNTIPNLETYFTDLCKELNGPNVCGICFDPEDEWNKIYKCKTCTDFRLCQCCMFSLIHPQCPQCRSVISEVKHYPCYQRNYSRAKRETELESSVEVLTAQHKELQEDYQESIDALGDSVASYSTLSDNYDKVKKALDEVTVTLEETATQLVELGLDYQSTLK